MTKTSSYGPDLDRALRRLQAVFPGLPAVRGCIPGGAVPTETIQRALDLVPTDARRPLIERILTLHEWQVKLEEHLSQVYFELNAILEAREAIDKKAKQLGGSLLALPVPEHSQSTTTATLEEPRLQLIQGGPRESRPSILDRIRGWLYRRRKQGGRP